MSQIRGSWLSLFAMLMIFIGPLISQAVPMDHHGSMSMPMSMDMSMDMPAHGDHAAPQKPTAEHHALWEKCGYCTLLFSCPALPHTADITLLDAPRPQRYLSLQTRLGHAQQPIFPGARSRAPPAFV
ncbi:DUF2946 domain-containing protein [Pseudomonas sp. CCC3.1]|uniref:DUF2946 domain-containing protein n=1 Tax=Pseudomonas sp. CCC3.1 TaxID=3048607 RepID=UPI002AC8FA61|nr:DUF2946 domain-containing protein [Pseudomonas sp. CCC3.1]MEB0207147.1 DUF2946 domain-containing protein [Pseudomonas sp. CCC3.1]WPX35595.1 DUF2946 domain-containing protein [Pseudomonas sp. CCC3.1]